VGSIAPPLPAAALLPALAVADEPAALEAEAPPPMPEAPDVAG
jgi:hypothetical protein